MLTEAHRTTSWPESDTYPLVDLVPVSPGLEGRATTSKCAGGHLSRASLWQRCAPLCISLLSTALSLLPAVTGWTATTFDAESALYILVENYRSTVQVIVGILASILGFLWTYAACSTFNLVMRSQLHERRLSLNIFRLYVSFSRRAVDTALPSPLFLAASAIYVLGLLPTWLWTGALTPSVVEISLDGRKMISRTGDGSYATLDQHFGNRIADLCDDNVLDNGTFTNCPGITLAGRLLESIGSASSVAENERVHAKFDNSGYSYVKRSYGAGASVGLTPLYGTEALGGTQPLSSFKGLQSYTFQEPSYIVDATCIYNDTSAWLLADTTTARGEDGVPSIWFASGVRPNDDLELSSHRENSTAYAQVAFNDTSPVSIVSISAGSCCGSQNGTPPFYVSFAAGEWYAALDKVQCQVDFTESLMNVSVYLTNNTIVVMPFDSPTNIVMEPRGQLREWTLRGIQSLAAVQTTLYQSLVGEAFRSNIIKKNGTDQIRFNIREPKQSSILPAIEDSLEAAMDDILVTLAAMSYSVGDGFTEQDASFSVSVLRIGASAYLIALVVANLLTSLVILAVSIYTGMFKSSPAFDFSDIGSMVVGVRNSKNDSVAPEMSSMQWNGDSADPSLEAVRLQVSCSPGPLTVAPSVKVS